VSASGNNPRLVVGVGASAGGLDALQRLLGNAEPGTSMAYVIVQHLAPDHESLLVDILGQHTELRVQAAQDGMRVAPDHVYVIPPNRTLVIDGDALHLEPIQARSHRAPIDRFFRSLAEAWGPRSACIVLSGSGSDGAIGMKAVKELGGLALAQDPSTAGHDSMPRHAIATGVVDDILKVEAMPARLLEYARHVENEPPSKVDEDAEILDRICGSVRRHVGHDFSGYKRATLLRRIRRRQQVRGAADLQRYAELLEASPEEGSLLFRDIVIGVTSMFRDPEAFEALAEKVVPELLARADPDEPIRIWVPGCSTGEEAYSLAILVLEAIRASGRNRRFTIFASDIDERALETARQGAYPQGIAAQVSEDRLHRYFERREGGFLVRNVLRESCLFASHDLVRDPPFSRIDLVSCRNLLIYFDGALQDRVLPLFHYALRPGGYLFLGPSENVSPFRKLFGTVDQHHRIYRRQDVAVADVAPFALFATPARAPRSTASSLTQAESRPPSLSSRFERALIDRYSPPSVVVDDDGFVVYASARTGRYLELPAGHTSVALVDMTRRSLQIDVRTALHQARSSGRSVVHRDLTVALDDGRVQRLDLAVEPLPVVGHEGQYWVVVFEELGGPRPKTEAAIDDAVAGRSKDASVVRELESELRSTKEQLQLTIEELETSNEELKSSNEELVSMNEELQSSNEELQTSKEELQSVNEELETVNAELSHKVLALDSAHSDLLNLFESTDVASLFVDEEARIKLFTPPCKDLFRLRDSDAGRPLVDIATGFVELDLLPHIERVQRTLRREEIQAHTESGEVYRVRVTPYRTVEQVVAGAVITFVDLTERVQAWRDSNRLAALMRGSVDAIVGLDRDARITDWNPAAERMFGWPAAEALGQSIWCIVPDDRRDELEAVHAAVLAGERPPAFETVRRRRDGAELNISVLVSPLLDEAGEVVGMAAIDRDISRRKRAEAELDRHRTLLQLILDHVPVPIGYVDVERRYRLVNREYTEWFDAPRAAIEGRRVSEVVGPESWGVVKPHLDRALAGEAVRYESEMPRLGGEGDRVVRAEYVPDVGPDGGVRGIVVLIQDVTAQRDHEAQLKEQSRRKDDFLAMLAHELRNPLGTIVNAVSLLRDADAEPSRTAAVVQRLDRQSLHLSRLVDDLLDVSRVSRGLVTLEPQTLDARDVVREVVADVRDSAALEQRTLDTRIPDAPIPVRADPTRLAQMLTNLLTNALKFTDPSGRVSCAVEREAGRAVFTVEDDGRGIEPGLLPNLFDLFRQGDPSLARERGGLGIGLTMVQRLAELHGGTVTARSDGPEHGASFRLELPVSDHAASGRFSLSEPVPAGNVERDVLVVDDDEDAAQTLAWRLERWGHDVRIAHDGPEALALASESLPELIFLDLGLPQMNGFEVARRLRALPGGDAPSIVILSGYGQVEDRKRSTEAGADAHLTKPASSEELRAALGAPPRRAAE